MIFWIALVIDYWENTEGRRAKDKKHLPVAMRSISWLLTNKQRSNESLFNPIPDLLLMRFVVEGI